MTLSEAITQDMYKIKRFAKGAHRDEIISICTYYMKQYQEANQMLLWYEEAIKKIVPDKADEIIRYVFSAYKADAIKHIPWLQDVEMGQASEE